MGIFNNKLEIDIENPFKHDKLQREKEVRNLTSLFGVVDNQMVLAVNSQWGTGKTSFLKIWDQYLKNDGYTTIFFDAWTNDYVEEPFIAFVDEIRDSINDEDKIRGFMEKAKDVGLALLKQSPKIVPKVVKDKTGFEIEEIISNDELSKMVSEKIDDYNNNKKSVEIFRKELEKMALKEFELNDKPMIIFVDELDRCRPDYAISLLERIKHFFNVQNIIFILGIDKEALSNSIKIIYGEQIDINGYLTKFIDLEYKIKDSKLEDYVVYLLEKYEFDKIFETREFEEDIMLEEHDYDTFAEMFINIVVGFKLSLRDIEKLIFEIFMILKGNKESYIFPRLLLTLCAIKRINQSLYNKLKVREIKYEELVSTIGLQKGNIKDWLENIDGGWVKACLIWLLNDNNELDKVISNANSVSEHDRDIDKDYICAMSYKSINETIERCIDEEDIIECEEILYYMAELYDDFSTN